MPSPAAWHLLRGSVRAALQKVMTVRTCLSPSHNEKRDWLLSVVSPTLQWSEMG